MRQSLQTKPVYVLALLFTAVFLPPLARRMTRLSREAFTLLEVAAAIHASFESCGADIWPGYDLSKTPYLLYLPQKLVLFLNAPFKPEEFQAYPSSWPDLRTTAFLHRGPYRDLVGQFSFDYPIDSLSVFAMGMPTEILFSTEHPALTLFRTTVHEGFHHFQAHHFGEIPWAREERYPILDAENIALASLEMHVLKDALLAMKQKNQKQLNTLLTEFVAVRDFRWRRGNSFVRRYEQGQEINEGTAKYVEDKALDCLLALLVKPLHQSLLAAMKEDLKYLTSMDVLVQDFEDRFLEGVVAPEDMPRNRIYPVGAALGFLLDALKVNWKRQFQNAGSEVSFAGLLKVQLPVDSAQEPIYLREAKTEYRYPQLLASAKKLIAGYLAEYARALETFRSSEGTRIEVHLPTNGLQRFRSTKEKRWIVENGRTQLCLHYNLYSLKSVAGDSVVLELRNRGLLEKNDWQKKQKTVIFYLTQRPKLILDGVPLRSIRSGRYLFKRLAMTSKHLRLRAGRGGTIVVDKDRIRVELR